MQGIRITSYLIIVVLFVLFIYLLVKGILEVKKGKMHKNTIGFSGIAFFSLLMFITFATPLMISFSKKEKMDVPEERITALLEIEGLPKNRTFSMLNPHHTYPFTFTIYKYKVIKSNEELNDDGRLLVIGDYIGAWNNKNVYENYGLLLAKTVIIADVYLFDSDDSRINKITPYAVNKMKIIENYNTNIPLEEQTDDIKLKISSYFS
ncbi:MAG: hypothetical protein GX931_05970 [Acholeplasmataceae bacterium]|jgi:hypothetical protein|nr:hypothetical protein [Acholeplasmataceae bacterium]